MPPFFKPWFESVRSIRDAVDRNCIEQLLLEVQSPL